MRPSLVGLYQRFVKETALLTQVLDSTPYLRNQHQLGQEHQRLICDMGVIQFHDAWARFCRELVVLSAYAQPLTAHGQRLSRAPGIQNRHQVIPALLSTYHRRKYEPSWDQPGDCIDAARRLQVLNYSTIFAGLGLSLTPSPIDQVRYVRNFLAHKNAENARRVAQVAAEFGLTNVRVPEVLVMSVVHPGVSVFIQWVHRLRLMAWLAIQ